MALNMMEIIIIGGIIVVFLFLGPKKITELARGLGTAKKEFIEGTQVTSSAAGSAQGGGDDLITAARKLDVSTEGKSRDAISAEIFRKTANT